MSQYVSNRASLVRSRTQRPFKFDHPMTMRSGYWIPIYVDSQVMPSTTFDLNVDCNLKALTLTRPPLCDLELVYAAGFVPHDITWNNQKQLWGETDNANWTTTYNVKRPYVTYYPMVSMPASVEFGDLITGYNANAWDDAAASYDPDTDFWTDKVEFGYMRALGLAQYMGYPVYDAALDEDGTWDGTTVSIQADALAFRAYAAFWNYFIRDLNCQNVIGFTKGDLEGTADTKLVNGCALPFNKAHDVFTGVLPATQYGLTTLVPLTGNANIIIGGPTTHSLGGTLKLATDNASDTGLLGFTQSGQVQNASAPAGTTFGRNITKTNLVADLETASGVSIEDLRTLITMQHFKETLAHYGRRMQDSIYSMYGGDVDNAILDEPEGIVKVHKRINIQTVTSTAEADQSKGLGFIGGRSETYISDDGAISYTSKKFGTFLIMAGIRLANHVYSNRIPRQAIDNDLWSQVNPLFAGTSDVPVYRVEMGFLPSYPTDLTNAGFSVNSEHYTFAPSSVQASSNSVLGYQTYGYEAKVPISYASGLMNPLIPYALSDFTAADAYVGSAPVYGSAFVQENPMFIGRAFVDQKAFAPQFTADWHITGSVTTPLQDVTVPGVRRV